MDVVLGERAPADPDLLARSLEIVAASAARLPTDEDKHFIFRRLSMQPELNRVIRRADDLREALGIEVQPRRRAGGASFAAADYYDAIRATTVQHCAELLDINGVSYELRELVEREHKTLGVVIVRDSEIVAYDFDWRVRLATASDVEVRSLLKAHRTLFELSESECEAAAAQVRVQDPVARVTWADDQLESLASYHFARLAQLLGTGVSINKLIPLDASCLARYAGVVGDEDYFTEEAIGAGLRDRNDWGVALLRFCGLPCALPKSFLEHFSQLVNAEQRGVIHNLLRQAQTVISRAHLLELAAIALSDRELRLLCHISIGHTLKELANKDIDGLLAIARWVSDEVYRRPLTHEWSAQKRALVTWMVTNELLGILRRAGHHIATIRANVMGRGDGREASMLNDLTASHASYIPGNITPIQLVICALANALDRTGTRPSIASQSAFLAVVTDGAGTLPCSVGLFANSRTQSDALTSYLSGDRLMALEAVLPDLLTDDIREAFSNRFHTTQLQSLLQGEDLLWPYTLVSLLGLSRERMADYRCILDQQALADPRMDLHDSEPDLWRLRLNVLARLGASIGSEADIRALQGQWESALSQMIAPARGTPEDAVALIEVAAILGRKHEAYSDRVLAMASALNKLASGPRGACVEAAGTFARRLHARLPAAIVSPDLSRAILTAKFRE